MPRLCSRAMSGRFSPAWTAKLLDLGDLSTSIAQSFCFPVIEGSFGGGAAESANLYSSSG